MPVPPPHPPFFPATGARILVCGAGFAGLTAAWWLHRLGHHVEMVERAPAPRRGGTPVDIRPRTIGILARMELIDAVRARSLPPRRLEFRDAADHVTATLQRRPPVPDAPGEEYEIDRDALLDLLLAALPDAVPVRYGCHVAALDQQPGSVTARFADGTAGRFDLVLGCDGTRSATRGFLFGNAEAGIRFMQTYAVLKVVPKVLIEPDTTQIHSIPGLTLMLNGYADKTDIAFGFRSDRELAYDHRDHPALCRLLRERYRDVGWRAAEMLRELETGDGFWFDRMCQVRLPAWSQGRVVLVGDAGYCPSPAAGMGGSLAIDGATALADALARHPTDLPAAMAEYDSGFRPFVEAVQDEALNQGLALFAPDTAEAIADRDRLLATLAA